MNYIFLSVCLLTATIDKFATGQDVPLMKLVFSRQAVRVTVHEFFEMLSLEAYGNKFQGFTGNMDVAVGSVNYSVSNLRVVHFPKPTLYVASPEGNTMRLTFKEMTSTITTDWSYSYVKWFVYYSDKGTGKLDIKDVSLVIDLNIGIEKKKPSVKVIKCTPKMGSTSYILNAAGWFNDMIIKIVSNQIRDSVQTEMCKNIINVVNKELHKSIQKIVFETNVGFNLTWDFSMTNAPVVSKDRVEILIRSRFKEDSEVIKIADMKTDDSSMMSLYISQEVFNSASRVLFKKGHFLYVYTTRTMLNYLELATANKGPDVRYLFTISSSSPPSVRISSNNITMKAELLGSIVLQLNKSFTYTVLRIPLTIECQFKIKFENGKLVTTAYRLLSSSGNISNSGEDLIKASIAQSTSAMFLGIVNSAAKSNPFPCNTCVSFSKTAVKLGNGFLVLATDLIKN